MRTPTRLRVTRRGDGVLAVHLAGGSRRNVIGKGTLAELRAAVGEVDDGIGCVLLTADGPDFSAGYDLAEVAAEGPEGLLAEPGAFDALRRCPVPVVAALRGNVLGGGLELALAADVRVADRSTRMALPANRLGLVYAADGLATLVEVLGPALARSIVLGGTVLTGRAAARLGLVQLAARRAVDHRAAELAAAIAAGPREAVRGNRKLLEAIVAPLRRAADVADVEKLHARSLRSRPLLEAVDRFVNRGGAAVRRTSSLP